GDRSQDGLLQVAAQAGEIRTGGLEHRFGRRVVEQRKQKVLDRHVLVTRLAGALVALADAVLEILAEHGRQPPGNCSLYGAASLAFPCPASAPFRPFPWCRARGAG